MPYSKENKVAAREFAAQIRASTVCILCGSQPVEWHNEAHINHPHDRVGNLVSLGFPVDRIQAEIDKCAALCRACHMQIDGRTARLVACSPFQKGNTSPAKPCSRCGHDYKPLRRGLCNRCDKYDRYHRLYARPRRSRSRWCAREVVA